MVFARAAALALMVSASGAPALAQSPALPPAPAPQAQAPVPQAAAPDVFGAPVTLSPHPMVVKKGVGTWDNYFDTLVETLKAVKAQMAKQGVAPTGPAMMVFTSNDDTGFEFEAGFPVAAPAPTVPEGFAVRQSPEGKALKFVHRGSYDSMTTTDDAITNHLDEKRLDQSEPVIEEYVTDPTVTADDGLIINLYVPIK